MTTVYVTHDQVEAMTMGDRVAVMKDGVLQQVDTPLALYDRPANLFVAAFIGSPGMNLMEATATDGRAHMGGYTVPIQVSVAEELGADAFIYGTCDVAGAPENVVIQIEARRNHQKGDTVHFTTDPEHVHVFDAVSGDRLSA